ncbi:MAG: uracil-DNA glycosylase family protein [Syntrophomonadaceae bacterium]
MVSANREQNIRKIIDMEDRICECRRCSSLIKCVRKPSQGKGDLEPDIILVFEYESGFCKEPDNVTKLRDMIKQETNIQRVYHTFMVRCGPKTCVNLPNSSCYVDHKLIDKDNNCRLSRKKCDGISIPPGTEEIMSCLPFLIEEIETLNPSLVILFGHRVGTYVLRSYGIFEEPEVGQRYTAANKTFVCTVREDSFNFVECKKI